MAISETERRGKGAMDYSDYTFICSRKEQHTQRTEGGGLLIKTHISQKYRKQHIARQESKTLQYNLKRRNT